MTLPHRRPVSAFTTILNRNVDGIKDLIRKGLLVGGQNDPQNPHSHWWTTDQAVRDYLTKPPTSTSTRRSAATNKKLAELDRTYL